MMKNGIGNDQSIYIYMYKYLCNLILFYRTRANIMEGAENTHGCKKQEAKDENGEPIYKAVELYAENATIWMKDFVSAFDKMQQNGYDKNDLIVSNSNPWSHRCCIQTGINLIGTDSMKKEKAVFYKSRAYDVVKGKGHEAAKSAIACQNFCQSQPECLSFLYRTQNGKSKAACRLRKETGDYLKHDDGTPADYFQGTQNAHNFMVGPKECPEEERECDMFESITFDVAA